MARFSGGVHWYTVKKVTITFPEDDVNCLACPLLGSDYGVRRSRCLRTGEYIPDPEFMIGGQCPLEDVEEEDAGDDLFGKAED